MAAALRLCAFLDGYYPEDFDFNLVQHAADSAPGGGANGARRDAAAQRLKAVVQRWLEMDPVHHLSLLWSMEGRPAFARAESMALVQKAIESDRAHGPGYHTLLGDLYSLDGKTTEAIGQYREARSLLSIHRNTTRTVLLTVEGMGVIAVEKAINAALGAVRDAVNGAAGVTLL